MGKRVGGAGGDQCGKFGVDGVSVGGVCTMKLTVHRAQPSVTCMKMECEPVILEYI